MSDKLPQVKTCCYQLDLNTANLNITVLRYYSNKEVGIAYFLSTSTPLLEAT